MTSNNSISLTNFTKNPEAHKMEELAIQVRNLNLSYGFRTKTRVMHNLSMELPRGSIYGLLGPSGCGKTSLIRCILGTLHPGSGDVSVFGTKPGARGSNVPGPGVGYMPQDITLYLDLTINETLFYFASLSGLEKKEISKRSDFLISFLNLPERSRMVGNLSGGQKRRVSLAVALIHKPPLLILDEPTVGVDPLLRKSIWEHLTELSKSDRLTVLITTHYIEEAKDANYVGFMRDGKILEQDNPDKLLERYRLGTLEQVFLHLCVSDEENRSEHFKALDHAIENNNDDSQLNSVSSKPENEPLQFNHVHPCYQVGVMVWKHLRTLMRSPGYLLFQFLLPVLQAVLFCSVLGRDLHSIPVAIFDGDNTNLSRSIVREIESDMIFPQSYTTEYEAMQSVHEGIKSTAMVISPGFETCLIQRMTQIGSVSDEILRNSTIFLYPDMSNQMMVQFVERETLRSFNNVTKKLLQDFGLNPNVIDFPVQMGSPIYGTVHQPYLEFMAPGAIVSIAFFASISLTSVNLVVERIHGLMERTNVVGVSHFAIIFAQLLTYTLVLLGQDVLLLTMILAIFKTPFQGSLFWIGILTALQSITGMCMGLLVSSVSNDEKTATMLSLGVFYPTLMLSSTMWPAESMNDYLRYFSYGLPISIPIRSMRYLMIRGWDVTRWHVANGFMVPVIWIGFFLIVSTIVFKYRAY